jgi:signal recognition particle receptor subunit beta
LHNAVKGNKLDVAVFLMEKGSNVNTTDNDLSSPLHYAVQEGHRDVIKFLVDNGADVLQRNREGKTAFSSGSSDIQSWLQSVMMQRKYKELYAEGTVPLGTVKVCFIGSAGAGKTTLMESMLRRFLERLLGSKENQPDEPDRSDLRTVGVNFKQVNVPGLGDCLLFDFAGQEQFHKTHGLLFPATKSVFILLVSLMVEKDEMVRQAKYWLSFLRACFDDSVKPIVLMAASRGDQCPEDSEERIEFGHVVEYMRQLFNDKVIIKESSVVLDCRKSSSDAMQQLKNLLDEVRT